MKTEIESKTDAFEAAIFSILCFAIAVFLLGEYGLLGAFALYSFGNAAFRHYEKTHK